MCTTSHVAVLPTHDPCTALPLHAHDSCPQAGPTVLETALKPSGGRFVDKRMDGGIASTTFVPTLKLSLVSVSVSLCPFVLSVSYLAWNGVCYSCGWRLDAAERCIWPVLLYATSDGKSIFIYMMR